MSEVALIFVKGKGRCFANQVGKCRGACNGQESIAAHTQRVQEALIQLQVNVWPWPGSIAIEEQSAGATAPASFDVDSHQILNRFLHYPEQHGLTVTPL
ncbi:hypothetical protein [Halomonas sp. IOP_14]|uniref:hypothetical protein n=1 Tax=Halomonas sp. IOP_14 TaxID=2873295 RepID=UPI001E435055|nr:hypothetical protein [Halomonas sp. IOP_14]